MRRPAVLGSIFPLLLAAIACAPALGATQVGVTSAVVPAARGTPTEGATRVLQVGLDMQANERVQTDAGGKAHLLFLDGSALSIGPNSDVVLDEYVYDPQTQSGKIALSATRGLFRLVGGRISKTTPVTLRTPSATIGVRGGIATMSVGQTVSANFLFGEEMFVEGGGQRQRATRAGFSIVTDASGAPQPPSPLTQESVDQQNAAFEGGGDAQQAGGPAVSDEDVANTQVSALNSTVAALDAAPAAGGEAPPPPAPPTDETTDASQGEMRDQAPLDGGDDSGEGGDAGGGDGEPTAPSSLTLTQLFSGRAKHASTPALGTDDGQPGGEFAFSGGTVTNGVFDAAVGAGRFTAPIQDGTFAVTSMAQPFGAAPLNGTGLLTADREFVLYELTDSGDGHKVLVFAGVPTPIALLPDSGVTFYSLRRDFVLGSGVPFVPGASGGDVLPDGPPPGQPNAAIVWDLSGSPDAQRVFGAGVVAISGQGSAQKSAVSVLVAEVDVDDFEGQMRGTSRVDPQQFPHFFSGEVDDSDAVGDSTFFGSAAPNYFVLEAPVDPGGVTDFQPLAATANVQPNVVAMPAAETLGSRTSGNLYGYSGGVSQIFNADGTLDDSSTIINYGDPTAVRLTTNAATNKIGAYFELTELCCFSPTIRVRFGDIVPDVGQTNGRSAFIDDQTFGAIEAAPSLFTPSLDSGDSAAEAYLLTADRIDGEGLIPPGVQLCACQYAVWGFWGGKITRDSDSSFVLAHLVPWAAGPIADLASIQGLTGVATYNGHVIGQVLTGDGRIYHAVGSLSLTADFGQQMITGGSIANYDGGAYNVTSGSEFSSIASLNTFSAGLTGVSGTAVGRSGSIEGSFVQGGGDPAAEVIGHFEASGTGYDTAGVLVGRRLIQ